MNVLSLFDGMSCGQIALNRCGIKYDNYFASEIDKYAIKVTQANYPNTIQLGDVSGVNVKDLPKIDLLMGGSPCQGFSFAGKQLAFDDPRSALFFEYVRILNEVRKTNPNVKFILENVRMKKEYQDIISDQLEVESININSNLVSAQNRNRFYWTNIDGVEQPEDKKIYWGDIKQINVPDNYYYSEKALSWISRHEKRKNKKLRVWSDNQKCEMIEASQFKNYSAQRFFGIKDKKGLRYITVLECERAQTVPDNYTEGISNTQRYKMLGNGWTVDVICHILNTTY